MKRLVLAAVTLLAATGGLGPPSETAVLSSEQQQAGPAVSSVFEPFYKGPIFPEQRVRELRASLPYESIRLERSGGMVVPGGHFKLALFRDGTATVWTDGANRFGKAGEYVGNVHLFDFAKLSHQIAEAGPERFARRYAISWTDMQEMTVSITAWDRTFTVVDYGGAGPVQLWAIQRAIEAIGLTINWKPK